MHNPRLIILCCVLAMAHGRAPAQIFATPSAWRGETVSHGNGIATLEFDPAGRMLMLEKQGRVLIAVPDGRGGFGAAAVFADLRAQVNPVGEAGLLGLALDPDYAANRTLYLFHTTATDQRLVRIRARADFLAADSGAPAVILSGMPMQAPYHKAGDIHFGAGDKQHILIALGDDGKPDSARNLDAYPGKILRVDKETGRGAPGNPFYAGDGTSIRSRVWASGFRNPFRFAIHPLLPDVIYVSENGGPMNQRAREDRIAWVRKGADCAWSVAAEHGGAASAWFSPPDAGCKPLATDAPSTVGIAIARRGPFGDSAGLGILYVSNQGYPSGGAYERNGSIRRWRLAGDQGERIEAMAEDGGNRWVTQTNGVDLEFGPDGALYASSTFGDASTGGWYLLRRVRSTGAPVGIARARAVRAVTEAGRWTVLEGYRGAAYARRDAAGRRIVIAP